MRKLYVLIALCAMSWVGVCAGEFNDMPTLPFYSTSRIMAPDGAKSTGTGDIVGPRRAGAEWNEDGEGFGVDDPLPPEPGAMPVGDLSWGVLLMLMGLGARKMYDY